MNGLYLITLLCVTTCYISKSLQSKFCLQAPKLPYERDGLYFSNYGFERGTGVKLKCPDGECMVYGDSRLDYSLNANGVIDSPLPASFMLPRVNAKMPGSISGSLYQKQTSGGGFLYNACGKYKIFYEGTEFSAGQAYSVQGCGWGQTSTWANTRYNFYKEFYKYAPYYDCLSVYVIPTADISSPLTKENICGTTALYGLSWYKGSSVDPNEMVNTTIGGLDPESMYIVPICTYRYRDQANLISHTGSSEPFDVDVVDGSGKNVFSFRGNEWTGTPWSNAQAIFANCTAFTVTNTASITYTTRAMTGTIVANRMIKFTGKRTRPIPIQVVESRWTVSRTTDTYSQEEPCRQAGELCIWYPVKEYWGLVGDLHGSTYVKELFSELDNPDVKFKAMGPVSPYSYSNGNLYWQTSVDDFYYSEEPTFQALSNEIGRLIDDFDKSVAEVTMSEAYNHINDRLLFYKQTFALEEEEPGKWCGDLPCEASNCFKLLRTEYQAVKNSTIGGGGVLNNTYIYNTTYINMNISTTINNTFIQQSSYAMPMVEDQSQTHRMGRSLPLDFESSGGDEEIMLLDVTPDPTTPQAETEAALPDGTSTTPEQTMPPPTNTADQGTVTLTETVVSVSEEIQTHTAVSDSPTENGNSSASYQSASTESEFVTRDDAESSVPPPESEFTTIKRTTESTTTGSTKRPVPTTTSPTKPPYDSFKPTAYISQILSISLSAVATLISVLSIGAILSYYNNMRTMM